MFQSWEIAHRYHEQTKHGFGRYARSLGYLDWASQPDPFRRFRGTERVELQLSEPFDTPSYEQLYRPEGMASLPFDEASISMFFQYSLALSAWKQFQDQRWALRINPSSGNLHPTEGYLATGTVPGLGEVPAIYHYSPRDHVLERRCVISEGTWSRLLEGFPRETILVGLSSIHWREAWKYGERAFRYCQHDVGHALAALALSAAANGWRTALLDQLSDAEVASLLGLNRHVHPSERRRTAPSRGMVESRPRSPDDDPVHEGSSADSHDVEREHPDLIVAIFPWTAGTNSGLPRCLNKEMIAEIATTVWFGSSNRLSANHVNWPILDEVAKACEKLDAPNELVSENGPSANDDSSVAEPGEGFAVAAAEAVLDLRQTSTPGGRTVLSGRRIIRQRRSAVAFDGHTSITSEQFYLMLDCVLPRFERPPWCALGPPVCAHLAIFAHRVLGLNPGLYFLVRDHSQMNRIRGALNPQFAWERPNGCSPRLPLYLLAAGDVRELASTLSCHQEIAGDGAFSLGMIVEFDEPLRRWGGWFYRRLFWETGMIGQVLYLEAEAAGVRGTGIGCFFDDPVHRLLGISGTAFQSMYHFTIGGPVDDPRLTTLSPYPDRA